MASANDRIFCNCAQCKGVSKCLPHIVRTHIVMCGEFVPLTEDHENDLDVSSNSDREEERRRQALHKCPHISRFPRVYKKALHEKSAHNIGESSHAIINDEVSIGDETNVDIVNREDNGVDNMICIFFDNANDNEDPNETKKEQKLLRDQSMIMLFLGSKTYQLSTFLLMLDLQAPNDWSDNKVTQLFKLLQTLLLQENTILTSRIETHKILDLLGMKY